MVSQNVSRFNGSSLKPRIPNVLLLATVRPDIGC